MINISAWMKSFLNALNAHFGERVWFVGLQGSYARGEATETSDIDVVVILDEFKSQDVAAYGGMLDGLPHRELICGFISGRDEIMNWEASDLFQFYHDTVPVKGSLNGLLERIDADAVNHAIKMGVCNIYHGCVHNMLHEKSGDILRALYKSAAFVMQAICFKQTGSYFRQMSELAEKVPMSERSVVDTYAAIKGGGDIDFDAMSERLFDWSAKWIKITE